MWLRLLRWLSTLLLPFACLRPTLGCQPGCTCIGEIAWCSGISLPRLPSTPAEVRKLRMIGSSVEEFSLYDLNPSLTDVRLEGLRFDRVNSSASRPSNIGRLEVSGCCADEFPNLSGLTRLETFTYSVDCSSDANVTISSELLSAKWSKGRPKFSVRNSCVSDVSPEALRRLLKGFKEVILTDNRLRSLRLNDSSSSSRWAEKVEMSGNPQLNELYLGKATVEKVEAENTALTVPNVNPESLLKLKLSGPSPPLDLSVLSRRFPSLTQLRVHNKPNLIVSNGTIDLPKLDVLDIQGCAMTEIPSMVNTNMYNFKMQNNLLRTLDLGKFPNFTTTYIVVSGNRIENILVPYLEVLKVFLVFQHLDVADNRLDQLPPRLLRSIATSASDSFDSAVKLNISYNPMRNIFEPTGVVSLFTLGSLNMTGLGKVREMGKLPLEFLRAFKGIGKLVADNNRLRNLSEVTETLVQARLSNFTKMKEISLNDNLFTEIPAYAFVKFDSLATVELARNRIVFIADLAFAGFRSLRQVDLRDNRLLVVGQWVAAVPSLLLRGNMISCDCANIRAWNRSDIVDVDTEKVTGLVCSSPTVVKHYPIGEAVREMGALLCKDKTPEDKSGKGSLGISKTELVIVLSVLAVLLLILSVVLASVIIARRRKVSYSLVSKENLPLS